MITALILVGGLLLALLGGWGLYRLFARLRLTPAERLALTLALAPAALGLAALAGLLAGRPGPLAPATACVVLGLASLLTRQRSIRSTSAEAVRTPSTPTDARHERNTPVIPTDARHGRNTPVIPTDARHERNTPVIPTDARHERSGGIFLSMQAKIPRLRSQAHSVRADTYVVGVGPGTPASASAHASTGRPHPGQEEISVVALGAGLYALGTLGTTLLTPLSGGALRIGDWVAHWFLVLVYAGQPLPDLRVFTNRVGDFGVISRPPLYNLEGGLLVGALARATGETPFWPFQLLTPLLAVPLVAAGILWALALGGRRVALVLAGLAGLSPFLLQNASYPWSKMVAASLVLLFLYLIREAALARSPARARQTFVLGAFCAGLAYLAHPTSIFYILPTLLWLVWRRPRPLVRWPVAWMLTTWALGGAAGLLAFGPWQGWVLATYGLQATLDANPASFGADVSETFGDWLLKGIVAAIGTLIPLPALAALVRGAAPSLDQLLRVQLALLTGALGVSGCWLLVRGALQTAPHPRPSPRRLLSRPPWLPLVVLCGFLGQVMLQPNWHDTGDAAESMTPIVVLGLALVAREALRLGQSARRLFFGLALLETALYLGLWLTWAFGSAWTRDPNAVLASRYGLEHLRGLWGPAAPLGAILLATGLIGSAVVLWHTLRVGEPVGGVR